MNPTLLLPLVELNYIEVFSLLDGVQGSVWNETEKQADLKTGAPYHIMNGVYYSHFSKDEIDVEIQRIKTVYKGTPMFWRVGELTDYRDILVEKLLASGFEQNAPLVAMSIDTAEVSDESVKDSILIKRISSADQFEDWHGPWAKAFGYEGNVIDLNKEAMQKRPDAYHSFVLYSDGKPVASSSIYFTQLLPAIYNVSVLPEFQGKGFGRTVVDFTVKVALGFGYDQVGLHCRKDLQDFYRKIGFKYLGDYELFSLN